MRSFSMRTLLSTRLARAATVLAGVLASLVAVAPAVHAAAPALTLVASPDTITAVIGMARQGFGAVAAIPLGDTLKLATDEPAPGSVERTIPRAGLWRAQTPQGFPRALLERAAAAALADGVQGTDDAELVERIGGTVRIVPDRASNLKLTTADDFAIALALLQEPQ